MNLSFRSYLYWMKILILIVTVILLLPKLFGFYYLSKGGKLLYKSLELAKISKTYSACAYSKQYRVINNSDNNSQVIFNEAIQNLKISSEFIPNNSQVQMLLGRAYCYIEKPQKAIPFFVNFTLKHPKNPLGHIELAFAIEEEYLNNNFRAYQGSKPNELHISSTQIKNDLIDPVLREWKESKIHPDVILDQGNLAFSNHNYLEASRWYFHYNIVKNTPLTEKEYFSWAYSTMEAGIERRKIFLAINDSKYIYSLTQNPLRIEGTDLRWAEESIQGPPKFGEKLSKYPGPLSDYGTMWWGGTAIAFLDNPKSDYYKIVIRVVNSPPAPVEIQFEHNLKTISKFRTEKEDLSIKEFSTFVRMTSGLNIIGLDYINNATVAGIDRNAIIESVELFRN